MRDRGGSEAAVRVQLLGRFTVWREGRVIADSDWISRKHRSLFKVLVAHRGALMPHEQLIDLVWPTGEPERARGVLRRRVHELRRILEPSLNRGRDSSFIQTGLGGYRFLRNHKCSVDAEEFHRHYRRALRAQGEEKWTEALAEYQAAEALYKGEFLEDDRYSEWTFPLREYWQQVLAAVHCGMGECMSRQGDYLGALGCYCRQAIITKDRQSLEAQITSLLELACRHGRADELQSRWRAMVVGETASTVKRVLGAATMISPPRLFAQGDPLRARTGAGKFVGRQRELVLLRGHLAAARRGRGRLVFIVGQAGIGKTSLLERFADELRMDGQLVVSAKYTPDYAADPLRPVVLGLAQVVDSVCCSQLDWEAREAWSALGSMYPELRSERPLPVTADVAQAGPWGQEALAALVCGLAKLEGVGRPLVLCVDDVHYAPRTAREWLAKLLPKASELPVLLVAAFGSELGERSPLKWECEGTYWVRLPPLNVAEAEQLAQLSAPSLDRDRRRLAVRAARGNPLFLVKLVGELNTRDPEERKGALDGLSVPQGIEELVLQMLEALHPEERRLAEYGAVLGVRFPTDVLERLWRGEDPAPLLDRLAERGLVVQEAYGWWTFAHELWRRIVYEHIGREKATLHRRAGEAIEELCAARPGHQARELARHFALGGEWGQALAYVNQALAEPRLCLGASETLGLVNLGLQAAEELGCRVPAVQEARLELLERRIMLLDALSLREEQRAALGEFERLVRARGDQSRLLRGNELWVEWGLAVGRHGVAEAHARSMAEAARGAQDDQRLARAHNLTGRVAWAKGRPDEAERCYREALAVLSDGEGSESLKAALLNNRGVVLRALGRLQESLRCLEEALDLRRGFAESALAAQTQVNLGNVHWALGQPREALAMYCEAYEQFRQEGDRRAMGKAAVNAGLASCDLGEYRLGVDWYTRAADLFRRAGDLQGEAVALSHLGLVEAECGRFAQARAALERAHVMLHRVGDKRGLAMVASNLGQLNLRKGNSRRAIPWLRQAYRLRREQRDPVRQGLNLSHLGAAHLARGDVRRARRCLSRALRWLDEGQQPELRAHALSTLALAHLRSDEVGPAVDASCQAVKLVGKPGGAGYVEEREAIEYGHYVVLNAADRDGEALHWLQRAHRTLCETSQKFGDEERSTAYLTRVPLNRRIVSAYTLAGNKGS